MLRFLTVGLAVLLLSVAPVMAQTPTPTQSTTSGIVRDLSESAERFGAMTVFAFAVVVLLIIAAWRGLSPLLDTIKNLNEDRARLQDELFRRLEAGDRERAKTAEVNERVATILSDLETKKDAQAARNTAVDALKQHTTTDGDKTRELLKPIERKLDDVLSILADKDGTRAAREDDLKQKLDKATVELSQLRERVSVQLNDSGEVTPLPAPTETPIAPGPSEVKADA